MPETSPETELAKCRAQIDELDLRLLALLNQRTLIAQEIGKIKQAANMAVYEPKREDLVYQNVTANNKGPLPNDAVRRVFERIIDEMRKVQRDRMEQNA
ncbi:MAG TPA: chorismate mutase [Bryobacteraceae bacterium]|nr:chorismate mutase [Bryobacteraceae bacterium]